MTDIVEEKAAGLFDKVKEALPKDAGITHVRFEGSDIILYTKNKEFFTDPGSAIREQVSALKKRIHLRPDPAISLDAEDAEKIIKEVVPEEAGIREIIFEPGFGRVTIEADKPGLVIGKGGETLKEVRRRTLWAAAVKRSPAIPSDTVRVLRDLIYKESEFRRDYLDGIGKRIHSGFKSTDWIRLTCLGAFREVGRSAMLLSTPESQVLLDCGVKPGSNEYPLLNVPEFNIQSLNAIVLSHSHLDHCAAIPFLYEMGFDGPLYCTAPVRDLMVLMCMDFIELSQREGRDPPYTTKGIKNAVKRCVTTEWGDVTDITPDMRLTLYNSGHILGGSICHVHIGEGLHNLVYTGDYKFDRTAMFEPASTEFARAETVITEATYGLPEDIQPRRTETEAMLVNSVKRVLERGGKAIISSFAVERAQDIQVILAKAGIEYPVYLDGMIWDATAIHTAYPEYMNRELQRMILQTGFNPFTAEIFRHVGSADERKAVIESKDPCVIISTSGMLTGGPVLSYLQHLADDPKNALFFTGYQGEGTLGRKIQKGWKEVPMTINGKTKGIPINLEIVSIEGLSGHSDYKQLINWLGRLRSQPERIIVNHGEATKCIELARNIHRIYRVETIAPRLLETIRLR